MSNSVRQMNKSPTLASKKSINSGVAWKKYQLRRGNGENWSASTCSDSTSTTKICFRFHLSRTRP